MGTPTFYWYPDGGSMAASREDTSLGETLTALEESPIVEREDAVAISGRFGTTVVGMPRRAVRIVLERFVDQDVARQLVALEDHLSRGGMCGFAADDDDGWCGYLEQVAERGDTVLRTSGNLWYFDGSLTDGDELVVQGLGPEAPREVVRYKQASGDVLTLYSGLRFTYTDSVVMVRARDCYPILFWPAAQQRGPALTTVRRIHWTWDIALEEDLALAAVLATQDTSILLGTIAGGNAVPIGSATSIAERLGLTAYAADLSQTGSAASNYIAILGRR